MAESSDQGILVAPSTRIPSLSFPTPIEEEVHRPVKQDTLIQNNCWMHQGSLRFDLVTLHLNQELCFNTAGSFTLILASWATEGVNLIDEDNGGLVLSGHAEQAFHQSEHKEWVWELNVFVDRCIVKNKLYCNTDSFADCGLIHSYPLSHSYYHLTPWPKHFKPFYRTLGLTSHSLRATWTPGLRRRWRRRWSCWPQWPQPWPSMTCPFLVGQKGGYPSMESFSLEVKLGERNQWFKWAQSVNSSTSIMLVYTQTWKHFNIKRCTCKEVRKLNWENDCFFQCLFSSLQTSHIIPLYIWLLHDNCT